MSERKENTTSSGVGCGCFSFIIFLVSASFFVSFLINCNGRGVYESAVKTTHDYYEIADSIWNKK